MSKHLQTYFDVGSDTCAAIELSIAFTSVSLCLVNKLTAFFTMLFPINFATSYFDDVLAGVFAPSVANAVLAFSKYRFRFSTLFHIMLLEAVCMFIWEGIAPVFIPWSIRDPWDCLAYSAGGLLYMALKHLPSRKK